MLRREPTGGTLYHAYAKSVENLDANFTNNMAANNCNIPTVLACDSPIRCMHALRILATLLTRPFISISAHACQ